MPEFPDLQTIADLLAGVNWLVIGRQIGALIAVVFLAAGLYALAEGIVRHLAARQAEFLSAYTIWLLFGVAGAHRVYFGRISSGLLQLAVSAAAVLTKIFLGLDVLIYIIVIWLLADAWLIPGWIRDERLQDKPANHAGSLQSPGA